MRSHTHERHLRKLHRITRPGARFHHQAQGRADVRDCYARRYAFEKLANGQTFTCSWLYAAGYDEDGGQIIRECGAQARETDRGWECLNGHEHLTYGSEAQQADERIEAAVELLASRDGSIAARLDAGESYRQIAGV